LFHPGKVVSVFAGGKDELSADSTVQAIIVMWDENMLTLEVHPKLRKGIREGDVVLVDYRPSEKLSVPVPKQTIVKILRGKKAQATWSQYTEYHEKRKRSASRLPTAPPGYIG
jgi:hypothetical protein